MRRLMNWRNLLLVVGVSFAFVAFERVVVLEAEDVNAAKVQAQKEEPIDFNKARELMQKRQKGDKLSAEEQAYLERAIAARRAQQGGGPGGALTPKEQMGFKPLTEMSADHK